MFHNVKISDDCRMSTSADVTSLGRKFFIAEHLNTSGHLLYILYIGSWNVLSFDV